MIVVVHRTHPVPRGIDFLGNVRTNVTITTTGAADRVTASTRHLSKRSFVEPGPETVRTNDIRRRRQLQFDVMTTEKIVLQAMSEIVVAVTITAETTTQMILHLDGNTWSGTGEIESLRRDPSNAVDRRRRNMALGIVEITTGRLSTATDLRTIKNRTRDRPATGKTHHAGRRRTVGSTTRIVLTGSTRINASSSSSGTTTIIPVDIHTTTAVVDRDAGKVLTRIKVPATGMENPRKTWTLAALDTSLPDGSAMFRIAVCSVGTRTRVHLRCTITIARWIVAVATWTGEDAAVALDHPTGTASTVPSRTWPTSRCINTNTIIRRRWDRIKVLQCSNNSLAAVCRQLALTHNLDCRHKLRMLKKRFLPTPNHSRRLAQLLQINRFHNQPQLQPKSCNPTKELRRLPILAQPVDQRLQLRKLLLPPTLREVTSRRWNQRRRLVSPLPSQWTRTTCRRSATIRTIF